MNHLEQLIGEYYAWQGYLVKHNVKVGRRLKGGWEMELDIIAYNPETNHLIHLEPSVDADTWGKRQERFLKKFNSARKYIFTDIFKSLDSTIKIEQYAILVTHPKDRNQIGGGIVKSIDEMMKEIRDTINTKGLMGKNAISEQYPLLRTIQLVECGYYKRK